MAVERKRVERDVGPLDKFVVRPSRLTIEDLDPRRVELPRRRHQAERFRNVAAAGVVPVIAAGNSRDEYGLGSVGSPGTAPDAITVAASSNTHVFTPSMSVQDPRAPATLHDLPFRTPLPTRAFSGWDTRNQTVVDLGSVRGTDGRPVDE